MDTPIIEKTKDYKIFKHISYNRDKNKRHIEAIKKMVMHENLLHMHPIIVNEEMEVVDGQHRLEAAKDLGIDVFYIKGKVSYNHILNSNLFQKKLSLNDVIKFYSLKDKLEDYIKFYEYISLLHISPKSFLGLFFGTISKPVVEFIKSGKFVFPKNQDLTEKIINSFIRFKDFANEKKLRPISIFLTSNFTIAFRNLVMLPEYNEEIFFNKLNQRWFDLKPQLNSKEWTRQLISIYNWKNHNPIRENFDGP